MSFRSAAAPILLVLLLCACSGDAPTTVAPGSDAVSGVSKAASVDAGVPVVIETGTFTHSFGLFVPDFAHHLLLYYRWNDGLPCLGISATEYEETTFHDIVKLDDWWMVMDKDPAMWFYVYQWDGEDINCAFLGGHTPLASGRGTRLVKDNDYYAYAPYAPGPNANAYLERYGGQLTTPAGVAVQFSGETNATADRTGNIIHWYTAIRLSPDPRY